MSDATDIFSAHGLESLIADEHFGRDKAGILTDPTGARMVFAGAEMMRSLHQVIEGERSGAWGAVMKVSGHGCGQTIATRLDARLAALGKPALTTLPLDVCLAFLERYFAVHGWGRLKLDLTHAAAHGLVIARIEHSYLVEALTGLHSLVDPIPAGILQGFFEHISGQVLGCEEIECARRGAARCTFAIAAPDRLATVRPLLGRESADAVIARLCR